MNKLPEISFIRECLDYDPGTGVFTWRERPRSHFITSRVQKIWNKRFAGKTAGWLCVSGPRHAYWALNFVENDKSWRCKAHRVAWLLTHGLPVPDLIDHADGDALNNRIGNLRAATTSQNAFNQRKQDRDTTSGVKGVFRHTRKYPKTPFIAYITVDKKTRHLGYFSSLEEAKAAREAAAIEVHGLFVRHK